MQGTIPLAMDITTPVYDVKQEQMPMVREAPFVDAVALTDGSLITLMIVNTHPKDNIRATMDLVGWRKISDASGRQIKAPSFMSRNTIEKPNVVNITELHNPARVMGGRLQQTLPPHSVTEIVFCK
jgi:alpha-L-arabinofuranosidase